MKKKVKQRPAQIWMGMPSGGCVVMPIADVPWAIRPFVSATPPELRERNACCLISSSNLAMVAFAAANSELSLVARVLDLSPTEGVKLLLPDFRICLGIGAGVECVSVPGEGEV
jgi:hypothetical protein